MYGTIARLRLKPGMEDMMENKLVELGRQEESLGIPGFIGQHVYRMDHDPNELYLVVLFDSRESYFANAQAPEQDARYREMLELLEGEPEWHDGEIIYSSVGAAERIAG